MGSGPFEGVTYIQRVNTMGGVAPKAPCDASAAGQRQTVSYSADYVFYKPLIGTTGDSTAAEVHLAFAAARCSPFHTSSMRCGAGSSIRRRASNGLKPTSPSETLM